MHGKHSPAVHGQNYMRKYKVLVIDERNNALNPVEVEASTSRSAANKAAKDLKLKSGSVLTINRKTFTVNDGKIM